ncbi:hypothetical protein BHE74_00040181 [Ensete ventricosum]|nr:hypothetical protein BHE74_00040181 [Ensete ventricosum]
MKRKTRQAKALENAKKAPRTFIELLQEANLEALPPHVPSYLRAAVGPPSTSSRRHFCTVCGDAANYTCVRCGVRFCSCRCQVIHNDTRCLKFYRMKNRERETNMHEIPVRLANERLPTPKF